MSTRTAVPLATVAALFVGFFLGLAAANPQPTRAVEADARADTLEAALAVTAARLDTLTDACYGVHAQNVRLGLAISEWPVRITAPREVPDDYSGQMGAP